VHNVSQWPNLRHLAEPLGEAVMFIIIIYLVESRRHAIVVATDTQETQG